MSLITRCPLCAGPISPHTLTRDPLADHLARYHAGWEALVNRLIDSHWSARVAQEVETRLDQKVARC